MIFICMLLVALTLASLAFGGALLSEIGFDDGCGRGAKLLFGSLALLMFAAAGYFGYGVYLFAT